MIRIFRWVSQFDAFNKLLISSLCFLSSNSFSQQSDISRITTEFQLHQKGKFYINWGYNRSWFNESDIHFTGQGHDFILYDVVANDRPSELSTDYINPAKWSIPQLNFRFGYFFPINTVFHWAGTT